MLEAGEKPGGSHKARSSGARRTDLPEQEDETEYARGAEVCGSAFTLNKVTFLTILAL